MDLLKKISLLVFVLLFAGCNVTLRHETVESVDDKSFMIVKPAEENLYGLQYALPNTGLRFCVTAERIEKKRGEFYLYSERYLGLKDVILEDQVEWKITSVDLTTYGEPSERQFVGVPSADGAPLFTLSEDGILLGVNDCPENQEVEELEVEEPVSECIVPYTEEMLLANSTAKMAQEAARYIYQLRESKRALISSDVDVLPSDGQSFNKSILELTNLEQQFVGLFSGKVTRSLVKQTIDIVPEKLGEKDVLFRFSTFNGLVGKDDLSGSPVYIKTEKEFAPNSVLVPDSAALYYVNPAKVQVQLFDGLNEILNKSVLMAQFGELNSIPVGALSDDVKIRFYPATGAIKSIYKNE